jgi:hypothetical protein
LRRGPQPPIPTVMPSSITDTASLADTSLSMTSFLFERNTENLVSNSPQ